MADETIPEIDLLPVWIRQISPRIGRRLLVRGDGTLAGGGPDATRVGSHSDERLPTGQRQDGNARAHLIPLVAPRTGRLVRAAQRSSSCRVRRVVEDSTHPTGRVNM